MESSKPRKRNSREILTHKRTFTYSCRSHLNNINHHNAPPESPLTSTSLFEFELSIPQLTFQASSKKNSLFRRPFSDVTPQANSTSMIVRRGVRHQQQLLSNQCISVSVICTRTTHKSLSERGHLSISWSDRSSYLFLPQEIQKLHTKPKPASSSADLLVNVQIFSSAQLSVSVPPDILAQRKWKGPKHDKTDQRAIWAVNMNKTPRFRHGY